MVFVNAPNLGNILAAFVTHLENLNWLIHRFAISSFLCNLAIMRFT